MALSHISLDGGGTAEVRCDLSEYNSSLWSDWEVNSREEERGERERWTS